MREDGRDGLGVVAHVVVFQFFYVGCVDDFANDAIDDDGIDGFLQPELLACQVVVCHHARATCERCIIGQGFRYDQRGCNALGCDLWSTCYSLVLCIREYECEMPMSASPIGCFNGSRNFGHWLLEMVYGGVGWLTCDFVKGRRAIVACTASLMVASLAVGEDMLVSKWLRENI